jgi:hypothetical protein
MKTFTKLKKIFSSDNVKKSKKRTALDKALSKLEKKGEKLHQARKANISKKKKKTLDTKLKTNIRHRKKARKLIKELS